MNRKRQFVDDVLALYELPFRDVISIRILEMAGLIRIGKSSFAYTLWQ